MDLFWTPAHMFDTTHPHADEKKETFQLFGYFYEGWWKYYKCNKVIISRCFLCCDASITTQE